MDNSISILGCGWLGFPLAMHLISAGYKVKGSTTSPEKLKILEKNNIKPFLLKMTPDINGKEEVSEFFKSDILLINIPPGTRKNPDNDLHVKQMQVLAKHLQSSEIKKIIYTSSTSIYPEANRTFFEDDLKEENDAGNKILYKAEKVIESSEKPVTVLRLGGLTGYDRILINFFSGKSGLPMGNCPVNLIHRDDVIHIIEQVIEQQKWGQVYNLCSPVHPLRKDYYPSLARKLNMPEPHFAPNNNSACKIINSDKVIRDLHYNFIFPDPNEYTFLP
ncbi:MAG: NAD(P)H-binding protein [Cytophagaceae bacterium]